MTAVAVGALAVATAVAALVIGLSLPRTSVPHVTLAHPDRDALADTGWRHGLARWECVRAAVVCAALLAWAAGAMPAPVVLAAVAAPSIWVRMRAQGARDAARQALVRIAVTTEAGLRSGTSLPEALRRAAASSPSTLAARPVVAALRAFDLGASLDGALDAAPSIDARTRSVLSTLALGIHERLPRERLADMLAVLADRLAFEDRLDLEVRARAAGARQQQRLLAVLVPAIAAYLSVTVPTLAATLGTDLGRFVLIPAAGLLELAGVVLGARIVRAVRP